MILYHGSNIEVSNPDILHSQKYLDFGAGFYVTSVKEQAIRWAKRKALLLGKECGIVSLYEFSEDDSFIIKDFADDLEIWIDFVCDCRNGSDCYKKYDLIKGKVANDKVFRVVDMYKKGIWDKKRTLDEIKVYDTYDQFAFISQQAIDSMLTFKGILEV